METLDQRMSRLMRESNVTQREAPAGAGAAHGVTATQPSPEMLTAMIKAEETIIESYRCSDTIYCGYVRRHKAGECEGRLLYPDEYRRTTTELFDLYRMTTPVLEARDPESYKMNLIRIRYLERVVGA